MTSTYFLQRGSMFSVTTKEALNLHESLPVGTYTVGQNPMTGEFFLETIEGFSIKGKLYGDTARHSKRIIDTFYDRTKSTGVMLSGEKGSGKTLLATKISLDAAEEGIPTIVINQPWHGEGFNAFMQTITQPTVVIFDEFEKVYDPKQQEAMLTLLDGVYPSKKLFIITCNDRYRVNEHMKNRPGRIFYRINYTGLDTDFIAEYCQDNLKNKEHIDAICRISVMFTEFNFDILKALVEEMNRYDENPQDAMKMLNAKPELSEASNYTVKLAADEQIRVEDDSWRGNPLTSNIEVYYRAAAASTDDDDEDRSWKIAKFIPGDLKKVDMDTGSFNYLNSTGLHLTLVKVQPKVFDYYGAL